jgi:hypothetical protein
MLNKPDDTATAPDAPALAAARILGGLIAACQKSGEHVSHAAVDLRAVEDIQRKLESDPNDAAARQWIRRLTQTWSYRARDNSRSIRRILDLPESRR